MQRWIVFIIALAVSPCAGVLACGYYPYGEDIRFHLLDPYQFGYKGFAEFNYTSNYFGMRWTYGEPEVVNRGYDGNILQWKAYCKHKVTESAIEDAVYQMAFFELDDTAYKNDMCNYLRSVHDTAALSYLAFAKKCETLNSYASDPWERSSAFYSPQHESMIREAGQYAHAAGNREIGLRYAFLAVRMAYYAGAPEKLKQLYHTFFSDHKPATTIDYWAMHFMALGETDKTLQNFYVSQVFAWAPEKRFAVHGFYNREVPVADVLKLAKNNRERGAIWLMKGIKSPGKAMEAITKTYQYIPETEGAGFLLLRELNKLEDWIYTPAYTYFSPSVGGDKWWSERSSAGSILANVARDRVYAGQLLHWMETTNTRKIRDKKLLQLARGYLHSMTRDPAGALAVFNKAAPGFKKDTLLYEQLQLLRAVATIAVQPQGKAVIPRRLESLILQQHEKKSYKFLFALGKELEFKGNTLDAALLFSRINEGEQWGDDDRVRDQYMYWKNRKGVQWARDDYFNNSFYYVDATYSIRQVKELLDAVRHSKTDDSFTRWKYAMLKKQWPRYQDLLGTKYIRANDLPAALAAFKAVPDTLWQSKAYPYHLYLDANPFYANMYNEHTKVPADSVRFTKTEIAERLISYLEKANDPRTEDRSRYYFLAANCYFNMTQYGNSWMMRRYYWSGTEEPNFLEDDDEFFKCRLAAHYYLRAKQTAKNKKFEALCLRMAGRCEKYRIRYNESLTDEQVFRRNKYYAQLKRQFPDDYDDLISNCNSFETYYSAR